MLFCFNPKANPRIEEIKQFLFFKRRFYKFFSTLLVFHSYLELFINHDAFNIRCKCLWLSEDLLPFNFTDSGIENVSVVSQGILEYGIAYVVKRGP